MDVARRLSRSPGSLVKLLRRQWIILLVVAVLAAGGFAIWTEQSADRLPEGFASANGRLEAV